jgi:hypothetical protein
MDKLMKLIAKKKQEGKEMDPMEKEAKMSNLKALRDEMSGMMKEDLMHPAHKVEVAASDEQGLEKGLDKAKQVLADHMANGDELGQDEADEHNVDDKADHGVDEAMEESAEEGDMQHPEHEGEMHGAQLSPEETALLQKLLAKAKMMK